MPRLLVVAALAVVGCADDATTPAPAVTAVLDEENIAEAGVTPVWTDDGVFVYGTVGPEEPPGQQAGAVALVDPGTGAVTPLPAPPFDHPLSRDPEVAVSSDDVFVMGSECSEVVVGEDSAFCVPGTITAAVWSLADEAWSRVVECGDTFAVVFGTPELTPANAGSQTLFEAFRQSVVDVTTSEWEELPPVPPEFLVGHAEWTGQDLLVLDFRTGDGITLTPDGNAWQPVSLPHSPSGIPRVWNGEEFVVIPTGS